jgi:hypothetical protein
MTSTEAQTMTGIERAMALDLLDADPITRLTEDENPYFSGALDGDTEDEAPEDWHWLVGVEG